MGPKTTILCERLAQSIDLLDSVKEVFWVEWLRKALNLIQAGDYSGIEHLRGAFGGMGSFDDLILASINGQQAVEKEQDAINRKLDRLRTELYALVQVIRHEAEVTDP